MPCDDEAEGFSPKLPSYLFKAPAIRQRLVSSTRYIIRRRVALDLHFVKAPLDVSRGAPDFVG